MKLSSPLRGALLGLSAAALFGVSAPLSKLLLPSSSPLALASLLYLGGGLALWLVGFARRVGRGSREAPLGRRDLPYLLAIILFGGILGPVLMLTGLERMKGLSASLLLNLEGPFTVLIALLVFREHLGRAGVLAVVATFGGAALLGFQEGESRGDLLGVLALSGACLSWAIDNNLTQKLSLKDPLSLVRLKALGSGGCMLLVALATGQSLPSGAQLVFALLLGAGSYGVSILLDTYALRILGAAREAAYFATAPFVGAVASAFILRESFALLDALASTLMIAGVVLLLRERHGHEHTHEALEHAHLHVHDEHHQHDHPPGTDASVPHAHPHQHAPITHDHPHVSDAHHRHRH